MRPAIDPDSRVTIRVRELLALPPSRARDALVSRTVTRTRDAESRRIATAAWVIAAHAEAEEHRKQAARLREAQETRQHVDMPTSSELAWAETNIKRAIA